MDETGELTLPADETLGDLADVKLTQEEAAGKEVQEQVGPLAADVNVVDLEIEE